MRRERTDHSLQATILAQEAFLHLVGNSEIDWSNRAHFFAGLGFEEIAGVLSISERTAKRDWAMARAWLYRELSKPAHGDA